MAAPPVAATSMAASSSTSAPHMPPRGLRALVQDVCAPYFEEMVSAVDAAVAQSVASQCGTVPMEARYLGSEVCAPYFEEVVSAVEAAVADALARRCAEAEMDDSRLEGRWPHEGAVAGHGADVAIGGSTGEQHAPEWTHNGGDEARHQNDAADKSAPGTSAVSVSQSQTSPPSAEMSTKVPCASPEARRPRAVRAHGSGSVCRHWQTKGWCRYEDSCRFAHPDPEQPQRAPPVSAPIPAAAAAVRGGRRGSKHQGAAVPTERSQAQPPPSPPHGPQPCAAPASAATAAAQMSARGAAAGNAGAAAESAPACGGQGYGVACVMLVPVTTIWPFASAPASAPAAASLRALPPTAPYGGC
mmetsp:Transcript_83043/g.240285  ORF Transcript_83043/g.240285 Transcript_83043/m.240285 type:complete len:358 (+) Transcript_83043:109-1182(+)